MAAAKVVATISKDPRLAAMVPASWRAKGSITVATNASYPPDEFIASNNTTIVGWDPDLGAALGKLLGLSLHFENVTFDEIIPGLAAHRYDMAMSSAGVEPSREKVVDFVTDFNAGMAFMVQSSAGIHPNGLASLCGLSVGAEKGSVEATAASDEASKCTASGKKAMKLDLYPTQSAVNLALSSNRDQVAFADSPVISYQVKQSGGKFVASGAVLEPTPEGIELPKGNGAMETALAAAMNQLISSGDYHKILADWGVSSGAITHAQIEPSSTSNG